LGHRVSGTALCLQAAWRRHLKQAAIERCVWRLRESHAACSSASGYAESEHAWTHSADAQGQLVRLQAAVRGWLVRRSKILQWRRAAADMRRRQQRRRQWEEHQRCLRARLPLQRQVLRAWNATQGALAAGDAEVQVRIILAL